MTLVCWGDSFTRVGGATEELARILSCTVFNAGVGGEGSRLVAARMSAVPLLLTAGMIVDEHTTVHPHSRDGVGLWPLLQGNGTPDKVPGLRGQWDGHDVRLSLVKGGTGSSLEHAADDTYLVDVEVPHGTSSSFDPDLTWIPDGAQHLVWMGQNDADPDETLAMFDVVAQHLGDTMLVCAVGTSAESVTTTPLEAAMHERFPHKFVNVRRFLIDEAPALAGIERGGGRTVPAGLLVDGVHHTLAAQQLIARHCFAPRITPRSLSLSGSPTDKE